MRHRDKAELDGSAQGARLFSRDLIWQDETQYYPALCLDQKNTKKKYKRKESHVFFFFFGLIRRPRQLGVQRTTWLFLRRRAFTFLGKLLGGGFSFHDVTTTKLGGASLQGFDTGERRYISVMAGWWRWRNPATNRFLATYTFCIVLFL